MGALFGRGPYLVLVWLALTDHEQRGLPGLLARDMSVPYTCQESCAIGAGQIEVPLRALPYHHPKCTFLHVSFFFFTIGVLLLRTALWTHLNEKLNKNTL